MLEQLAHLLPRACQWVEQQEQHIIQTGVALTSAQLLDARDMGVQHPERVRLLQVARLPMPADPQLRMAAAASGLLTVDTIGLSVRYGIFVRIDVENDRSLLAHELVHTAQYERLGGIAPFLRQYFTEVLHYGYTTAPLEQEARRRARRLEP